MDEATAHAMAAASGDRAALELFARSVQADVWRYCSAMVGAGDASDVAQESLLRIVRSIGSYRADAPALVWALSIARHAALDWLRRAYRRDALVDRLRASHRDEVRAHGGWAEVTERLAGLDAERREAFVLTQLLGWSYADAAQACSCPVGTIRSRVARARLDLLAALEADAARERREPS